MHWGEKGDVFWQRMTWKDLGILGVQIQLSLPQRPLPQGPSQLLPWLTHERPGECVNSTYIVTLALQATYALNQETAGDYWLLHNNYIALTWVKWKVICKSEQSRLINNIKKQNKQMVGLKNVCNIYADNRLISFF